MLLPTFEWFERLPVSQAINESVWIFAVVQAVHLLFLALLAGAVLVVDLRLLGQGFTERPIADVARSARPWLLASLVGMLLTGIPQLIANATRQYHSEYFWWKMYLLAAALIFTFTIRRTVTHADSARFSSSVHTSVALASIALWTGVAINGRLIGLFT